MEHQGIRIVQIRRRIRCAELTIFCVSLVFFGHEGAVFVGGVRWEGPNIDTGANGVASLGRKRLCPRYRYDRDVDLRRQSSSVIFPPRFYLDLAHWQTRRYGEGADWGHGALSFPHNPNSLRS